MCHMHSCSISTFATFHFLNVYFRIFLHPDGSHENGGFPPCLGFDSKTVQRSALCRSRRELSNAYLLAKFGFDTAENEPSKVCRIPWQLSVDWSGGLLRERALIMSADWDSTWAVLIAPVDPWREGEGSISAYQPTVSPKFRKIRFLKSCAEIKWLS